MVGALALPRRVSPLHRRRRRAPPALRMRGQQAPPTRAIYGLRGEPCVKAVVCPARSQRSPVPSAPSARRVPSAGASPASAASTRSAAGAGWAARFQRPRQRRERRLRLLPVAAGVGATPVLSALLGAGQRLGALPRRKGAQTVNMNRHASIDCPFCEGEIVLTRGQVRELADSVGLPIARPSPGAPASLRAPAAQARAASPRCPEHHRASPSQYGGLYCPEPVDGGWCRWTGKGQAA